MTIFASNRPSARTGRHGALQKYEDDCASLFWTRPLHRPYRAGKRGSGDDRRPGHDARRTDRQRQRRAAHPPNRRNRSGKMRPQLVSRVVARSIRLYPSGRGRVGASTRDLAGRRDAAAGPLRITNLCHASGVAMDRALYRPQRGFFVRLLVAVVVFEPETALLMSAARPYMSV